MLSILCVVPYLFGMQLENEEDAVRKVIFDALNIARELSGCTDWTLSVVREWADEPAPVPARRLRLCPAPAEEVQFAANDDFDTAPQTMRSPCTDQSFAALPPAPLG